MINTIDAQLAHDRQGERLAHARAYRLAKLARQWPRGGRRHLAAAETDRSG